MSGSVSSRRFAGIAPAVLSILGMLSAGTPESRAEVWPLDARGLAPGDSVRVAEAASLEAALDSLDAARWAFLEVMIDGSFAELRAISDVRGRSIDFLSRSLGDSTMLAVLPWSDRTRWVELALSERRGDWLRPLLKAWSDDLPASGDSLRGRSALAVGLAALQLCEEDPEEDRAFLTTDPEHSLDAVAVRFLRAAAQEDFLLRDEAMHRLAARAEAEGDTVAALAWADSLVLHVPESPRVTHARVIRARAWLAAGNPALAEEEALRGMTETPRADVRWVLARARLSQGRVEDALRTLDDLVRATPADPLAAAALDQRVRLGMEDSTLALPPRELLAQLELLLGNPALDSEARLGALALDPDWPVALREEASLILAKFQYRGKRYASAEERVRTLLTAADSSTAEEARLHLARILRNTGRTEAMAEVYRSLLAGSAERSILAAWELGREWESSARWRDAELAYSDLIERHPGSSRRRDALFRRGFACDRQGRTADAIRDFRLALAASRTAAEREQAAFWAARALRTLGREKEAQALAKEETSTAMPADAYGVLLRERFLPSMAEAAASPEASGAPRWVLASPPAPGSPGAIRRGYDRGMALLRVGVREAARDDLRRVASQGGRSPEVLEALARVGAAYDLYPEGVLWANRALEATADRDPAGLGLRRLAYPAAHAGQVVPDAARAGLDPALVWALMRQESLYDPRAVSRAGAMGLMQLMPATLGRMIAEADAQPLPKEVLLQPEVNIAYGTRFLADRLAEFENRVFPTLASYNAGERKAREWLDRSGGDAEEVFLECIGYAETHGYVRRIVWLRWMYHELYGVDREGVDE